MELFLKILLIVFIVLAVVSFAGGVFLFFYALKRPKVGPDPTQVEKMKPHWDPYLERIKNEKEWFFKQKMEEVEITSFDGLKLRGLYIPAENPSKKTILAIHGYKCCGINEYCCYVRFYHGLGYNVMLPDDRAHGKSEGKYIGFGWFDRLDCISWAKYLVKRNGEDSSILLQGISMGSATVMAASGEESLPSQVKGVIADCGFSSAWDEFSYELKHDFHLPVFPMLYWADLVSRVVAKFGFKEDSAVNQLKKTKIPVVFIHGEDDDFVPTEMVYKVSDACASDKEVYTFPGAKHAMSYFVDTERYEKIVKDFAQKVNF